jgi:hypothetical protein
MTCAMTLGYTLGGGAAVQVQMRITCARGGWRWARPDGRVRPYSTQGFTGLRKQGGTVDRGGQPCKLP